MSWLLLALLPLGIAGDPCPIDLRFGEYTPSWRDRDADLAALQSQRTLLGVSYGTVGDDVVVRAVVPDSPASRADLRQGDVFASVGGTAVTGQAQLGTLLDDPVNAEVVELVVRREGVDTALRIERERVDPVLMGLVNTAENTECRSVQMLQLDAAQQAAVAEHGFDDQRAFRCEQAHEDLARDFQSGDVILVRGGSRLLLVAPGWHSTCVGVDAYDGEGLTRDRLGSLLEQLTSAYVADRHANP